MKGPEAERRAPHAPVLVAEVIEALAPADGEAYLDGTFGAGGYSRAILEAARCQVYAIDRDPASGAQARLLFTGEKQFVFLAGRYGDMQALLAARGVTAVNGIALDLGVSSMQLDDPARGFSFRADGPLDMRMEGHGPSAADMVNRADEATLASIIRRYGEERYARRIARAIVAARHLGPIGRTGELAEIIVAAVPPARRGAIHPATRTFQALRIHVNDELAELQRGLRAAERLLAADGRLVVVSFHSLEDRLVKDFLRRRSAAAPRPSRHVPTPHDERSPSFQLLFRGIRRPREAEIAANPRARSAKLRAGVRTAAPVGQGEAAA